MEVGSSVFGMGCVVWVSTPQLHHFSSDILEFRLKPRTRVACKLFKNVGVGRSSGQK